MTGLSQEVETADSNDKEVLFRVRKRAERKEGASVDVQLSSKGWPRLTKALACTLAKALYRKSSYQKGKPLRNVTGKFVFLQ